jgi:hypothetical protein
MVAPSPVAANRCSGAAASGITFQSLAVAAGRKRTRR